MTGLLWIFTILFVLLTIVDPRKLWYSTSAWQFKHPEANEPSEASFAVGRVVAGISALCFGAAAIATTAGAVAPLSQERLDSAGRAAARELGGEYYKYGSPGVTAIQEALGRDDVQVREGERVTADGAFGESRETQEYFDIEGVDDTTIAGCMELSYLGGLFHEGDIDVSASYSPGAC
ncbi:hypothetical protein GCM10023339_42490 [Alloalcanivorax gelatiniphagus]